MKLAAHGKESNIEFSFKMTHCHLSVALHVEIAPEALLTATPAHQDSSERMNKICTDVAHVAAQQIYPIIGKLHAQFLQSLESAEIENQLAWPVPTV